MNSALLLLVAASTLMAQTPPPWTLSPRPTLDIGDERQTHTQFNGIAGVVRMGGGEIVVANAMSQELRVFSPSGDYLRTLSTGTPLGDMRALGRVWRGGDTIYAAEILPAESNVWVFTLKGFVDRRSVGAANAGGVYPIDRFADGRFVVTAAPRSLSQAATTSIDSTPIGIVSIRNLAAPHWIRWLKNETVAITTGGGRGRGRAIAREPYPYGRSTSFAVSGDRLWVGDSETGTITQHNSEGRGLTVLSPPIAPRALDTAAIRRFRARVRSDPRSLNRSYAALFYPLPSGGMAPRFSGFLAGTNGELWIQHFDEDPSTPRRFVVLSRAGLPIGAVTMPAGFVPFDVGPDAVLGVRTDDDGVEHVVRYSLRRSP